MEVEMAFNANFLNARLKDGTVTVSGTSLPATKLPIMVTLAHKGELRSNKVDGGEDDPWRVKFGPGKSPFALHDLVHVTGVALRADADEPFVWQGSFKLVDQNAPPG
jgi:hypothetical protein